MRQLLNLSWLLVALLLSACDGPETFISPISAPGSAVYEERLVGTWYGVIEAEADSNAVAATITIAPREDEGLDFVASVMASASNPHEVEDRSVTVFLWVNFSAHASEVDGETYYNLQVLDSLILEKNFGEEAESEFYSEVPRPGEGYWIARAEFSDKGWLTLYAASETYFRERKIHAYDLSPNELVALIRSAGPDELFTEDFGPFARIEGSYPPQNLD